MKIQKTLIAAGILAITAAAAGYCGYSRFLHPSLVTTSIASLAPVSEAVYGTGTVEPERWAKVVMGPAEAARCRERHLRVIYRFLLYWRATGQTQLAERGAKWLAERGALPSREDYARSVLEWPLREVGKRLRRHKTLRATEALGFGPANFPSDGALPRLLDVRAPKH